MSGMISTAYPLRTEKELIKTMYCLALKKRKKKSYIYIYIYIYFMSLFKISYWVKNLTTGGQVAAEGWAVSALRTPICYGCSH